MDSQIVFPESFNTSHLTISTPRSLDSGAKQSFIGYKGGKLVLQTASRMPLPFGLNVFESTNGSAPPEFSIDVSFKDEESRKDVSDFKNAMTALDEYVISEGVKNTKLWFKGDYKEDVIRAFYSPCLRYSKDKNGNRQNYPPTMKLKLKRVNGDLETKFFNTAGEPFDFTTPAAELLPKGGTITALIQCTGVWFAGGKFGLSWRTKQIVIHSRPEKFTKFAIRLDGSVESSKRRRGGDEVDNEEEEEMITDDVRVQSCTGTLGGEVSTVVSETIQPTQPFVSSTVSSLEDFSRVVEPVPVPTKTTLSTPFGRKKKVVSSAS